jgi:hypothetical protein
MVMAPSSFLVLLACVILSRGFANESQPSYCIHDDERDELCIAQNAIISDENTISIDDKRKWNWDPSNTHPCNIRRISRSELNRIFGTTGLPNLYPSPLIVYPDPADSNENGSFANLTTIDNLPLNFPSDFEVTLSGSDSLSSHRRTIPLKQYLHEILTANSGLGETLPNQLGNETWYLFGETFSKEWVKFLQEYELPPCQSCTTLHRMQNMIALSFGIGNRGSGVQWHMHGPGFSETIHGRKHWVMYPPSSKPIYDLNYASRHWMENMYPTLKNWTYSDIMKEKSGHDTFLLRWKDTVSDSSQKIVDSDKIILEDQVGPSSKKPWECTVSRGEMIYFPDHWHHATVNLEKYTVFVSSFTTETDG